jgi:hypothetical protein
MKRIQYAFAHPDAVYVDTDCFLLQRFQPVKKGVPYFARFSQCAYEKEFPDVFYFHVNGAVEFFKPEIWQAAYKTQGYGFKLDFMLGLKGFEYIDESYYLHPYTTAHVETAKPIDNTEFKKQCVVLLSDRLQGIQAITNRMLQQLN